jgi:DNA invertase Pin-like site-specific DNA recombinase
MWGGQSCLQPPFLAASSANERGSNKVEIRLRPHQHRRPDDRAALKHARCSSIFENKGLSGASAKRPALSRCLKTLQAGHTLTVWNLDQLGRSLRDLITMLDDRRARGVRFHSLTEAIDLPIESLSLLHSARRGLEDQLLGF